MLIILPELNTSNEYRNTVYHRVRKVFVIFSAHQILLNASKVSDDVF